MIKKLLINAHFGTILRHALLATRAYLHDMSRVVCGAIPCLALKLHINQRFFNTEKTDNKVKLIISTNDYLRPWKLFSLSCGVAILIAGALTVHAMDWNIPICFLMAISTYIFAPITSRTFFYQRCSYLPLALFGVWFSVDGIYWLYWHFKDPAVVAFMRAANFLPSLCLYLICAGIWLHDGTLDELLKLSDK